VTDNRVERRLAAILAADVAGYSRMMNADEEGVLARLKAARKSLVDPTVATSILQLPSILASKTTDDGMLVESASADMGQDRSLSCKRLSTPDGTDHDIREFLPRMSSAVAPAQ